MVGRQQGSTFEQPRGYLWVAIVTRHVEKHKLPYRVTLMGLPLIVPCIQNGKIVGGPVSDSDALHNYR